MGSTEKLFEPEPKIQGIESSSSVSTPGQREEEEGDFELEGYERECRICGDRSDGAHFGVESCRACAAFFRRTTVLKKKYFCRLGKNNCPINKSIRCMCRKCRHRKCLQTGMQADQVQKARDPIKQLDVSSNSSMNSPSESEIHLRNTLLSQPLTSHPPPIQSDFRPSTSSYLSDHPDLIHRILANYRHLCAVRRTTEMSMNLSSIKTLFDTPATGTEMRMATCVSTSKIYQALLPAIADFLRGSFEQFETLSQDEKWTVFQSFMLKMLGIDSAYLSYKYLPPELFHKRKIMTESLYMDVDHLHIYLGDSVREENKADVVNLMSAGLGPPRLNVVRGMAALQVTELEYAALIGLITWSQFILNGTEEINRIGDLIRKRIFQDLHNHYRTSNVDDSFGRLGELMCLYTTIHQYVAKMKEDMELYSLFEFYPGLSSLYDLLKR